MPSSEICSRQGKKLGWGAGEDGLYFAPALLIFCILYCAALYYSLLSAFHKPYPPISNHLNLQLNFRLSRTIPVNSKLSSSIKFRVKIVTLQHAVLQYYIQCCRISKYSMAKLGFDTSAARLVITTNVPGVKSWKLMKSWIQLEHFVCCL